MIEGVMKWLLWVGLFILLLAGVYTLLNNLGVM